MNSLSSISFAWMPFSRRISLRRSGKYSVSLTTVLKGDTCGGSCFPGAYSATGSNTSKLQQSATHWLWATSMLEYCLVSMSLSVMIWVMR